MAKAKDGRVIKDEDRPNGQITANSFVSSRSRAKPRKNWTTRLLSNVMRIVVLSSIITVLFRCPAEPASVTASDPAICRPYLSLRTYLDPYVGPYYESYVSPYVEKTRPYVETANTRIIRPATVLAINNYNKYAAPEIAKARDYTLSRWEANGLPQLKKAQEAAQQVYDAKLAPHVQKASEVAGPYYETALDNALSMHENHIVPALTNSKPHLQAAYSTVQKAAIEKGLPFVQHIWTHLVIFVDGTLWPFVKKVYGDNVRPQLVMIGERIAKYQEGRKLQSAIDEVDESLSASATQETFSSSPVAASEPSAASWTATAATEATESSIASSSAASSSPTVHVATDQTVAEDLVKWQKKFAIAADKGTDDLRERIDDIVASLVKTDFTEGQGLATALEKTSEVELDSVKAKIKAVVSTLSEDAEAADFTAAEAEVVQAIRNAGSRVRDGAKKVRTWAEQYSRNLQERTELATESTLQVLDGIRDLGLQEIGLRWAWMDGITYKHWEKFHNLRRRFADWRSEVHEVALAHEALADAREEAQRLLEESMATTENAAKELIRLRDVAKWKIAARDASDDFDTREIPVFAAAASAASNLAANVKEAMVGSSQESATSPGSIASEATATAAEEASSLTSDSAASTESLSSLASSQGSTLADSASLAMSGTTGIVEPLNSQTSDTSQGTAESLTSSLAEAATSARSSAAETAVPSEGVLSSASSVADSISLPASSALSSASVSQKLKQKIDEADGMAAQMTSSLVNKSD